MTMEWAVVIGAAVVGLAVYLAVRGRNEGGSRRAEDQAQQVALQQAIGGIQQAVGALQQGLDARLQTQDASLGRQLEAVRADLGAAGQTLAALRGSQESSQRAMARVEQVIAGTQAKGAAGEALVLAQLQALPPEMLETNFGTPRGIVEYALRLPDGRRLPVDAKFPATDALEQLAQADVSNGERDRLAKTVRGKIKDMAEEVSKYRDPNLTTSEAVCAVPDAAYSLCGKIIYECFQKYGVMVMPYSMLLPFLLAYYRRNAAQMGTDSAVLVRYLQQLDAVEQHLGQMEHVLKNSVDKPAASLKNAADNLRTGITEIRRIIQARPALMAPEMASLSEAGQLERTG